MLWCLRPTLACLAIVPALLVAQGPDGAAKDKSSRKAITSSIGMKLVFIPPGTFTMGSPATEHNRASSEDLHEVTITRGFYMSAHEVTQAQFQKVMGNNPSYFKGDDLPVEMVSWKDAAEFCKKLSEQENKSYRLPTEAEWEYACRAGTSTTFHFGRSLSSTQANINGSIGYYGAPKGPWLKKTTRVGSYQPNAFGLYDMHGNVWELCQDWYPGDYKTMPKEDPQGPDSGHTRVMRGGSWDDIPFVCRAALRAPGPVDSGRKDTGFRVVLAAAP